MKVFAFAFCILLLGCATKQPPEQAGWLIYSTESDGGPVPFSFQFRQVEVRDGSSSGEIVYDPVSQRDEDTTVAGLIRVVIRRLEPGDYEIYSYKLSGQPSLKTFSIRFTIKPGQATYVGALVSVRREARDASAEWLGVVNMAGRDINAAKMAKPDLPPVTISVTDVSKLDVPALTSTP